jgi:hypothetical protein
MDVLANCRLRTKVLVGLLPLVIIVILRKLNLPKRPILADPWERRGGWQTDESRINLGTPDQERPL